MRQFKLFLVGFLLLFGIFSCSNDPFATDLSKIKYSADLQNLDSLLVNTSSTSLAEMNQQWRKELGEGYDYVIGSCLQIISPSDSVVASGIQNFRKDKYIAELEKEIEKNFYPIRKYQKGIDSCFARLKSFLPKTALPEQVIFANTLFNSSVFATEKQMVIGMERYLGAKHPLLNQLPPDVFYEWVKEGMEPRFLKRDLVMTWLMTHVLAEGNGNLAEEMIRYGKILLMTEATMPEENKEVVLRYTKSDFEWAEENSFAIWDYLKKEELLFKNDERDKMNFFNPGPFTVGLPEKGPDRLGQYLGWKMVHVYLEKNEVTLRELMEIPYTKILQEFEID